MQEAQRVLVGVVGAAQGVRGEVRVKSYTAAPAAIGSYGPLAVDGRGDALVAAAVRPLKDDMVVVRFEGIADRDAAAALTGTRLYVDRARLPPPEPDEVYHVDLVGLDAEDEAGRPLGRVSSVENYGAGDILAIVPPNGGDSLLVPFTKAFVPLLDLPARRLVVAEGALAGDEQPSAAIGAGEA